MKVCQIFTYIYSLDVNQESMEVDLSVNYDDYQLDLRIKSEITFCLIHWCELS
jgi:hypothetical protein